MWLDNAGVFRLFFLFVPSKSLSLTRGDALTSFGGCANTSAKGSSSANWLVLLFAMAWNMGCGVDDGWTILMFWLVA
jgi:hypothetical protein